MVTAHVTKEGTLQEDGPGSVRQRLEVETEADRHGVTRSLPSTPACASMFISTQLKSESDQKHASAARPFRYGERLRFPAKISAAAQLPQSRARSTTGDIWRKTGSSLWPRPRPQASRFFPDLPAAGLNSGARESIAASSTKSTPCGRRGEAALMDAMVIGEDAFINRATRADFQRSGTYHVLVVSGMNVDTQMFQTGATHPRRGLRLPRRLAGRGHLAEPRRRPAAHRPDRARRRAGPPSTASAGVHPRKARAGGSRSPGSGSTSTGVDAQCSPTLLHRLGSAPARAEPHSGLLTDSIVSLLWSLAAGAGRDSSSPTPTSDRVGWRRVSRSHPATGPRC